MKYLILEDFSGQPICFIFPRRVDHGDMRDQLPYTRVLSAGYVEIVNNEFHCHGSSTELGVVAHPQEDAAIIRESLRPREPGVGSGAKKSESGL